METPMSVTLKPLVVQLGGVLAVFALALFVSAGTLAWPAGWIFLGLFLGFALALFAWLYRHDFGLFQERLRLGTSDQQPWDKVLFPLLQACLLVWLMVMGMDAVRLHWSALPRWLQGLGAVILLGSFWLFFLTFRENSFLSPVVRIQADRGQTVISTGPYHVVRHPMYSAILVFMIGTSLLLASGYGLLVGSLGIAVLARRAVLEERVLIKELADYRAYQTQVKYRFLPYLW